MSGDTAVLQRAAEWWMQLESAEVSAAERAACRRWREADATHEAAWRQIESLWARFDDLPAAPASAALQTASRARLRWATAATTTVLLVLGLSLLLRSEFGGWWLADHRNDGVSASAVTLDDGSQVTLDANAGFDVHFDGRERRLDLRRGEILIDVAADAARPFVVATAQGTARALGTRYLVRREAQATVVTVIESVVRACTPALQCVELRAGESLRLDGAGVPTPQRIDAEAAAAWSRGLLVVDDRPLPEVLAALQAHRDAPLHFAADSFGDLRVSGVYSLRDPERALQTLAGLLPIRIEKQQQSGALWVLREPAAGANAE